MGTVPDNVCLDAGGSFYCRADWSAAGIVAVISLIIYMATLAPTVTLEQSGAFVVAGQYLGVGRVPGYPVWHLCAKLFTFLFGFVHYRGQPNPAWALNFMSAFFGSLSCGLLALIVSRIGRELHLRTAPEDLKAKSAIAAVVVGIFFAVSHAMWSQSVITETHTLTLFFLMFFLTASLVWFSRPTQRVACLLAFGFGVGLAQSHMLALLMPSFLLVLVLADRALCRDFLITFIPVCVIADIPLWLSEFDPWFWSLALVGILLCLTLSARFLPRGRMAACMVGLIVVGLSLYAYLPLASEGNPPMCFGYPRIWNGFKHVITRGQYERMTPVNIFLDPIRFLEQLKWFVALLGRQFLFPFALLALFPICRISRFHGMWLKAWSLLLLTFFTFSVILIIGASPKGDIQDTFIQQRKFIPAFAVWAVFMGLGFVMALDWIERLPARNA